jgi:hypothetical protein
MTKKMVEEHQIERVNASTAHGEPFRTFLEGIDPTAVCGKCGGLPYDIVFTHSGTQYKFCLYKIQKEGKILAETDYEKLHEYTKKGGEMMRQRK